MKNIVLLLLFTCSISHLIAQKKLIDSSAYHFCRLGNPIISNNGVFVFYQIIGGGCIDAKNKTILQSLDNNWRKEFLSIKPFPVFSYDSKYFFFITMHDSLGILNLKSKLVRYIPDVSWFKISEQRPGDWLFYQLNDEKGNLVFENLKTEKKKLFRDKFDSWIICEDGKSVIHRSGKSLEWINLTNGETITIWEGENAEDLVVDFKNSQLAWKANDSLLYYKKGMSTVVCLARLNAIDIDPKLEFGSIGTFSKDGRQLFLSLKQKEVLKPETRSGIVEVWGYRDANLQSQQEINLRKKYPYDYKAVISLIDHKIVPIQQYEDEFFLSSNKMQDSLFLTSHPSAKGNGNEITWNSASQLLFDIINAKTGDRKRLNGNANGAFTSRNMQLSPTGEYLLYFDESQQNYFSYSVIADKTINLTRNVYTSWSTTGPNSAYPKPRSRGIAGWFKDGKTVLVYDSHDIWKLDVSGKIQPVNITNGYGVKHHIIFDLGLYEARTQALIKERSLILSAFNTINKDNGFFRKDIEAFGDPELLSMGPYIYKNNAYNTVHLDYSLDFIPVKAKNKELYIVQRTSATDAPNYFATEDFKTYKKLTDLQPQKEYNWYTAELHHWKSLDGKDLQGILYKPENFDPHKKYPVIFYYYERLSDGLNAFIYPSFSYGALDIPTYVSNGYLVFCPDIYYLLGDPMQGTYDAVVSAANYVSTLPFVNPKKMGIQGHSFGGGQTNFLITHTNLFAAACSSSSVGDWISAFGAIDPRGESQSWKFTTGGQYRMGSTLWENPAAYIKNSPFMHLDKVSTPLLMKQGKKDGTCLFSNATEFFVGLRRLGKKVWMLAYPGADHVVDGDDAKDFTIRMQQFFDHYLMDKPAPIWMTQGIPTSRRGLDNGYEYDTKIKTPGPGLLTEKEQQKVDSLLKSEPRTIPLK